MSLPSDPTTRPPFSGFTAPPRSSSAAAGWTKPSSSANAGLAPSSGFFPQPLPTQTQPILVPQSLNPTIINPPASVPTFALILPTLERSMQHPDLDLGAALPAERHLGPLNRRSCLCCLALCPTRPGALHPHRSLRCHRNNPVAHRHFVRLAGLVLQQPLALRLALVTLLRRLLRAPARKFPGLVRTRPPQRLRVRRHPR
ncbi:uncharacterized protein BJ171DRAFT_269301 [Polychytrium aggregatum]|uniref:uncharacterized protein n=1 Tax=Polychytrium aggregatum TaxID=110093 RepID=UPI0022FDDCC8|nr:uncharacterized protein BJ171DRAFT_269301 [Polychytrium aggregatum]KAI9193396.1 hypothetical protein BJ171DRAFT_269301 [Polychytrium aggregatum]